MSIFRRLGFGERRQHARRAAKGVRVWVEGEEVQVADWSLGGFRARALPVPYERGARVAGEVRVGRTCRGRFTGVLVARYPDGDLAVQFDEIDSDVFRALNERSL